MSRAQAFLRGRSAVAIFFAIALLFAQWTGLAHRIEHMLPASAMQSLTGALDEDTSPSHSCLVFDAAAAADAVIAPPFLAPLMASVAVLALWLAFKSWDAPLVVHFSTRAPPRS